MGIEPPAESVAPIAETLPGLAPFRPRLPWLGPDLQTLRNVIRRDAPDPGPFRRLWLDLPDGDALAAALHRPGGAGGEGAETRPLVVLVHGLTGCEDSPHLRASARFWLGRGQRVLRLNLRGSAPSRPRSTSGYHAGRSADLRDALLSLDDAERAGGLFLVGVSLGGTMLLRFLAEEGLAPTPGLVVRGAATLCAPVELMATARRMMAPRNAPYHRWLLGHMKREAEALAPHLPSALLAAALAARSICEFDHRYVAPLHGFAGAPGYYAHCALARHLPDISVPTLCLTSADDPWVPAATYRALDWAANPRVQPLVAAGGGHVGFHDPAGRQSPGSWADRAVAAFLGRVPLSCAP